MSKDEAETEEEIMNRCWGQWVAAKVVERDKNGQPVKFRVVASSGDRYYLRNLIANEDAICIFYAGPVPRIGSGLI